MGHVLFLRKGGVHTKPIALPTGYTRLQYIQSSGTQWVDSLFTPNQDTRIEMDVIPLSIAEAGGSSGFIPYGAAASYNNNAFECYTTASKLSFNYDGQYKVDGTVSVGAEIHISHDKNNVAVSTSGGIVIQNTFTYNSFTAPHSLTICGTHRSSMLCGHQRVKNCQLYDNGTLIRDYVPCINPSGEVGLYDLVGAQFYGNSGTGVFYAGPRKVALPEGYTQVEYIQSSGTQWADTGFSPKWNTRMILSVSDVVSTASTALFGCRKTKSMTAPLMYGALIPSQTAQLRSDYFGSNASVTVSDKTPRTMLDKNANVFSAYGLTAANTAVSSGDVELNCYLFCYNNGGSAALFSSYRLFSCQIYDNETLVRDFIPCKNAAEAVGLYDLVNSQFYGNAGEGTFEAGPAVTWEAA